MPEFPDGAHEAKRETRVALLAHRRALTAPQRAEAAARIRAELVDLVRRLRPRRMTGYVPVGSEPGGPELPEALRAALPRRAELLLPVLRDDLDLDWAAYDGPDSLVAAGRGMREPAGPRLGRAAISEAELVVVPALAVDHRGLRLGRGGGSYDRALARVPGRVLIVALLHDGELVEALPAQPHDRPVHAVITPSGGLRTLTDAPSVDPPTSAGRTRAR
ncbi:5-formyltetrahydrofolate cyclo-ligase [Micromonospora purpureochromogenes]|uniref:5-formyltetrahydrofolate cyclo-ligase n=1 Tax=Micromonospora purpureochromogenes TaxID=47872 RepID=A0ABX2RJT8_9ACTN|nr:5-formyltetrahydrofolate cyclo-ligase [Micromonospora purpureochromogenes]NYF56764.1 5-formyltetrahydrofolate cyclo-ligase [Micromonospora purpureochromogenes]